MKMILWCTALATILLIDAGCAAQRPTVEGDGKREKLRVRQPVTGNDGALRGERNKQPRPQIEVDPDTGEKLISLDFDNVDVRIVIKLISDLTKKNFIISDDVRGSVTVTAPTKIPVSDLSTVLASILDTRGLAMVQDGKFIRILPKRKAVRIAPLYKAGRKESAITQKNIIVTRLVTLENADPRKVVNFLQSIADKDSMISLYPDANVIVITDTVTNVERLMKILEALDMPANSSDVFPREESIMELISKVSAATGKKFIVNPHLLKRRLRRDKNVILYAPPGIPKTGQLSFLEAVLDTCGYAMEPCGDYIKVLPRSEEEESGKAS